MNNYKVTIGEHTGDVEACDESEAIRQFRLICGVSDAKATAVKCEAKPEAPATGKRKRKKQESAIKQESNEGPSEEESLEDSDENEEQTEGHKSSES